MAAAASWMESSKLPLREVRKRYTKSELAIMAWRSGEVASNMRTARTDREKGAADTARRTSELVQDYTPTTPEREKELAFIEEKIGGFIWKAVTTDEHGNETGLDLRKLSPEETRIYMEAMGYNIANPGGR